VAGTISAANSLLGTWQSMYVGMSPVTALTNGNYVVENPLWDACLDCASGHHAGAVTWGSGTSGIVGVATAANSLVGTRPLDRVGSGGVIALTNGDYIVRSPTWDNGVIVNAGAVTLGSGSRGVTGAVSAANSLAGITAGENPAYRSLAADGSYFFATGTTNRVLVGLTSLSQLTYNRAIGQTVTLQPSALAAQLATGSSLVLQASNDITLNSALVVTGTGGGALTLQAGRSLLINGNITMKSESMLSGLMNAGWDIDWIQFDAVAAIADFSKGAKKVRVSFTADDAKQAGLIPAKAGSGNQKSAWREGG
jgi:hypothetical protein